MRRPGFFAAGGTLLAFICAGSLRARLVTVPAWPMTSGPMAIVRSVQGPKPFSVAAEHGAIFGTQDGIFEAWAFPVKLLSHFKINAELAGYPVPVSVNEYAAQIEVNPERTTITYSHAAFTVRQHMISPRGGAVEGTGPLVFFEIESVRPIELTFQFTPEMLPMWPAANWGRPNAEWVGEGASGFYILHTDTDALSGAVGIPGATPGIMAPYQERPKTWPVELKLNYDPKKDSGKFFPLLMGHGTTDECRHLLETLNARVEQLYRQTADYYAHFFDRRLWVESPDPRFDLAIRWAEIAIDQAQVKWHDETGLVAGYYSSGDSARPGFGWFFGRDTEYSVFATSAYGDFDLTRTALDFLFRRQRADGKIMHEFSQSADQVDWKSTPYFFAAADATPLLILAVCDYVNISGDREFLRRHWEAVKRAYAFQRTHAASGGIYGNAEGTGWVESWPGGMPRQEIYMAALDQQAALAIQKLAGFMQDPDLAKAAAQTSSAIGQTIQTQYFDAPSQFYAFSRNPEAGTNDLTPTIYPAVAWWTGTASLANADAMLDRWGSHEFSSDWGTRDVSETSPLYDPISYHQGTVWPLFTGWVSLAEFRAGRTIAATQHLYQNLFLTWAQDLGACAELLSGAFYQPLGRSSSHQTWSSAMVLTPALRGLLGLDWDVAALELRLKPSLPPDWSKVRVHNLPFGERQVDLDIRREGSKLRISVKSQDNGFKLCVGADCSARREVSLTLPPVEIGTPLAEAEVGSATHGLKVVHQEPRLVRFEAPAGASWRLPIRINEPNVKVRGGEVKDGFLTVAFSAGEGWKQVQVNW